MEEGSKSILILTTGGTIGSAADPESGVMPGIDVIEEVFRKIPDAKMQDVPYEKRGYMLSGGQKIDIEIKNLMNKDSTDMTAADQAAIAKAVFSELGSHDGIVITHGTDTLHFLSSMLSLMMKNISKPVVVTGAMRIPEERNSDAVRNLRDSILFASGGTGGIFVVFHGKVMEGAWVHEFNPGELGAFESSNGSIGRITDLGIQYLMSKSTDSTAGEPSLNARYDSNIVSIAFFPGLDPDTIMKNIIDKRGLILVGYGSGGYPSRLVSIIEMAATQMPVILTSHSPNRKGLPGDYEISKRVSAPGMIVGHGLQSLDTSNLIFTLGNSSKYASIEKIGKRYRNNLEQLKKESFMPRNHNPSCGREVLKEVQRNREAVTQKNKRRLIF